MSGEEGQSFGEFIPMKRCQFSMRTGKPLLLDRMLRALILADRQANGGDGHSQGHVGHPSTLSLGSQSTRVCCRPGIRAETIDQMQVEGCDSSPYTRGR